VSLCSRFRAPLHLGSPVSFFVSSLLKKMNKPEQISKMKGNTEVSLTNSRLIFQQSIFIHSSFKKLSNQYKLSISRQLVACFQQKYPRKLHTKARILKSGIKHAFVTATAVFSRVRFQWLL
jgi:hypothetical protein